VQQKTAADGFKPSAAVLLVAHISFGMRFTANDLPHNFQPGLMKKSDFRHSRAGGNPGSDRLKTRMPGNILRKRLLLYQNVNGLS